MRIRQRLDKLELRRKRKPVDPMYSHDRFFREINDLAWAIHLGVKPPDMTKEEWTQVMEERERFRKLWRERECHSDVSDVQEAVGPA